jgi:hypothetical protein
MAGVGKIENLKPFEPGKSGNPGGLTKELRAQIDANAVEATRIRTAMLAKYAAMIDPDTGAFMGDVNEAHAVVKASEERGFGAPQQTTEHKGNLSVARIECLLVDPNDPDPSA